MEQDRDREYAFLLQCLRSGETGEGNAFVDERLREDVDWQRLLGLARAHGVLPLVARALTRIDASVLPEGLVDEVQRYARSIAMHNLHLVNEVRALDELLALHQIKSVFFKGPLLAIAAYGGLDMRRSTDIDVLVSPGQVRHTEELLREHGFVPFTKIQRLGPLRKQVHLYLTRQLPYRAGNRAIDLHSGVVGMGYGFTLPFETLYARSRTVEVAGTNVRTFGAEDMVLVLCYQGVNNRWGALKYLCDLTAHVESHESIDWTIVRQSAEEMNGSRIVRHGLDLARLVLGCTLPPEMKEWLASDDRLDSVQKIIVDHLKMGLVPPLTFRQRMNYYPGVQNTLSGKSRYVLYSLARRLVSPAVD